jgi:hypothetical protein
VHISIGATHADLIFTVTDVPDGRPDDVDIHFGEWDGTFGGQTAHFRPGNVKIDTAPPEVLNAIVSAFVSGNGVELMLLLQPFT